MALALQSRLASCAGPRVAVARPASAAVQNVKPYASAILRSVARSRNLVVTKALFGFGGGAAKSSATTAATTLYVCTDCGWIYDGKDEFKKLPGSFKCPVCSSPKSRFKVYKGDDVRGRPNNTGSALKKRLAAKQW